MSEHPISINPNIQFGSPCLTGTRIHAWILLQHLYQQDGNVREASRQLALDMQTISVMQAEEAMLWLIKAMSLWIFSSDKRLERVVKAYEKKERNGI